jgi:hypothetical protein
METFVAAMKYQHALLTTCVKEPTPEKSMESYQIWLGEGHSSKWTSRGRLSPREIGFSFSCRRDYI